LLSSFSLWLYFALPAFLAQASLQYLDFALNVVYGFLQTGHFLSIQIASLFSNTCFYNLKAFSIKWFD
jgi:hypothetical protein